VIKAREAGSRIISTNAKRYGYHPLRGFNWPPGTWPGAHAPGFTLSSAPRTGLDQSRVDPVATARGSDTENRLGSSPLFTICV